MQTATERRCANPTCGRVLDQKPGESGRAFRYRKTCNHVCAGALKSGGPPEPRYCVVCGDEIEWDGLAPSRYERRTLCGSMACHSANATRGNKTRKRMANRDPGQRRSDMTAGQRDAYRQFCSLVGIVSEAGTGMHGTPEYVAAIDTALRIAAGRGNDRKRGGGSPVERYGEGA